MRFRVTYTDGGVDDVVATASARLLYEQEFNKALIDGWTDGRTEGPSWIAWKTLQRTKVLGDDVDLIDWLDGVETVEMELPADAIAALAALLGVVEGPTVPTSGTGKPSQNGSRKPRSKATSSSTA